MKKHYNRNIDVIIPAYNVDDEVLFRCLSSIACQDIREELKVSIVDDASTKQNYESIVKLFLPFLDIQILRYEINGGPGVARQYGLDHTTNGYVTFIDADDTFNGAFAIRALRTGIEYNNNKYKMCVGVFDEVHNSIEQSDEGPVLMDHERDMVWMFGKMYRRSFIDQFNIHFHESSRANEDNGFNTMFRLCCNEQEDILYIPTHVYYWHENPNSITRVNDCQYSFGSSERDSFYGYVENMIFAITEAKKRNPYNGMITMWTVSCLLNLYEYYIECCARAPEHADKNLEWCRRYYEEAYSLIEETISDEIIAQHYTEVMRNAYIGGKLDGIIPSMSIYDFILLLKRGNKQ